LSQETEQREPGGGRRQWGLSVKGEAVGKETGKEMLVRPDSQRDGVIKFPQERTL
jgi:hypothetical protein